MTKTLNQNHIQSADLLPIWKLSLKSIYHKKKTWPVCRVPDLSEIVLKILREYVEYAKQKDAHGAKNCCNAFHNSTFLFQIRKHLLSLLCFVLTLTKNNFKQNMYNVKLIWDRSLVPWFRWIKKKFWYFNFKGIKHDNKWCKNYRSSII